MPQYKVVELREGMIGGKISGDKLEKVLNEWGSKGAPGTSSACRSRSR